jgi:hypothetical protein
MEQYVGASTTAIVQAAEFVKSLNVPTALAPILRQGSESIKDCAIYLQSQDPNAVGIVAVAGAVVILAAVSGTCLSRRSGKKNKKSKKKSGSNKKKKETSNAGASQQQKSKISRKKTDISVKQGHKDHEMSLTQDIPESSMSYSPASDHEANDIQIPDEVENVDHEIIEVNEHIDSVEHFEIVESDKRNNHKVKAKKRRRSKGAKDQNNVKDSEASTNNPGTMSAVKDEIYAQDLALAVALAAEEARSPSLSPVGSPSKVHVVLPKQQNEWETVSKRKSRKPKPVVVQPVETEEDTDAAPDPEESP